MNWNARPNYGSGGGYGNQGGGQGGGEYQNNFPNSGALFPVRQKRSDQSPDMTGNVEISEDVLDYILREAQRGDKIKLELSAWIRMSRNNNNFTSLKVNIPYEVRMAEQGNPTYRAQPRNPNYNQRQMDRPPPPQPRQSVRQGYAEQSGRSNVAPLRQAPLPRYGADGPSDPEFSRGDRMPDFGGSNFRGSNPNDPPF